MKRNDFGAAAAMAAVLFASPSAASVDDGCRSQARGRRTLLCGAQAWDLVLLRETQACAFQRSGVCAAVSQVTASAITGQLEEMKAAAILDPSPENVTAYVRFQREQLDTLFPCLPTSWTARPLARIHGLDYTLQRPSPTATREAETAKAHRG